MHDYPAYGFLPKKNAEESFVSSLASCSHTISLNVLAVWLCVVIHILGNTYLSRYLRIRKRCVCVCVAMPV